MSSSIISPIGLPPDAAAREERLRARIREARERAIAERSTPSSIPAPLQLSIAHPRPLRPSPAQMAQQKPRTPRTPLSPPHSQQSRRPAFYSQYNSQPSPEDSDNEDDNTSTRSRPRSHSPDLSYYQSPPQRYQQPYRQPPSQQQMHSRPRDPAYPVDPRQRIPPPLAPQYRGSPPHGRPPPGKGLQYIPPTRLPVRVPARGPASLNSVVPPPQRKPAPAIASPTRQSMNSRYSLTLDTSSQHSQPTYFDQPTGPGLQESAAATPVNTTPSQRDSAYATPLEWPVASSTKTQTAVMAEPKAAPSQLSKQRSSSSLRPLQQQSPSTKTPGASSVATFDSASDISKDDHELDEKYAEAQAGLINAIGMGKQTDRQSTHAQADGARPRPNTPDASVLLSAALGASMIGTGSTARSPEVNQRDFSKSSTADNLSMAQRQSLRASTTPYGDPFGSPDYEKSMHIENGAARKSGMLLAVPEDDAVTAQESNCNSTRSSFRKSHRPINEPGVRDSTTSLPGLIRRALRLATNMEQNRTQSRWGSEWMTTSSTPNTAASSVPTPMDTKRRSAGSLNTIINAFPLTPTGGTPQSQYGELPIHQWPQSQLRHMQQMSSPPSQYGGDHGEYLTGDPPQKRQRYCGMPLWLLVLVILFVVILIAAAIAIPVALIVVPRQHADTATKGLSIAQCAASTPCANGGSSFVSSDGSCSCVCSNGYTGANCEQQDNSEGCTTIATSSSNVASIGSALPALLTSADSDYEIPLDTSALLSLFALSSLSCASQNALVTLNGAASSKLRIRQASTNLTSAITLNFARISILYIYQADRSLDDAISAQSGFQNFLLQPSLGDANNITLTSDWAADLTLQTLMNSATGKTIGSS